jgi:hypothetical protein
MEFVPSERYEMVLFDSEISLRVPEFRRFRSWLEQGALVIFHNTAPHRVGLMEGVRALIAEGSLSGVDLPTPRGIFIGRVALMP